MLNVQNKKAQLLLGNVIQLAYKGCPKDGFKV